MGKWMKAFRKLRHLDLVFGLICLGIAMWILSGAWTANIITPDAYVPVAPTITLFWILFILGILTGISITTYVILELIKD